MILFRLTNNNRIASIESNHKDKIRNMKKSMLLGLSVVAAMGMSAAPLTPQQALERMQRGRMGKVSAVKVEAQPVYTQTSSNGVPTLYVFNCPDNQGYRILSADDAAYAVIGYSDTGSIDPENMPPQFRWWLNISGDMIAYYAGRVSGGDMAPANAAKERIDPLCKSKWNQDKPYNNMSPKIGTRSTYTGCVATSMAQVMYYHKYPEIGEGSNSYRWESGRKTLSMNFDETPFDWDNMLDVYTGNKYTATEADAVAFLMKSCGYGVDMNFGTSASGAQGPRIAYALKKYFKYDGNCNVKYRMAYSETEWADMVYNNLKNVGPVIMNGHEYEDAGHSFICDGYDGNGYYHFNWGWGGMSDGYFSLEALDPNAHGIGGGAGGGFNYGLNGIFGIQPPTGEPIVNVPANMLCYGGVHATLTGNTLQYYQNEWYPQGWYDAIDRDIRVNMGATIEPVNGTAGDPIDLVGIFASSRLIKLSPGSYYNTLTGPSVTLPALKDGRYKVTLTIRDMDAGSEARVPIIVSYGCPNYVYVNVAGGQMTVENVAVAELVAEGLTLDSELFYDRNARYKAKLKNDSEFQLTENIVPALLKTGKIVMVGNQGPTTVDSKTEGEFEWICKMRVMDGISKPTQEMQYELAIINPVTKEILGKYGTVTMKPEPLSARLQTESFIIEGATTETIETNNGQGSATVNVIPTSDFNTVLKYVVDTGFFDGVISYNIYERPDINDFNTQEPVAMGLYTCQPLQPQGTQDTLDVPIDFTQAQVGAIYSLRITYTVGTTEKLLNNCHFRVLSNESGVEDVRTENADAPVRYFNLQGIEIKNPAHGQIVIVRQGNSVRKVRM